MRAIIEKDLTMVLRNPGVRIPILAAPIVILVVLPVLLVTGGSLLAANTPIPESALAPASFRQLADAGFQSGVTGMQGPGVWAVFVLEFFLAPLYLLIPLVVSTVIAADSFAGERERRTLEALLHTPTTDRELFFAKVLAAWIPAIAVGLGGFVLYTFVANLVAWPYVGAVFFPNLTWLVLAIWVTPAVAGLGLGLIVIISSRVRSLQSAHQIGSLVVLPVLLLLIAQISGTLLLDARVAAAMGLLLWAANIVLLWSGSRNFHRNRLAEAL